MMWRTEALYVQTDTVFTTDLVKRLESDTELCRRADALLDAVSESEPLILHVFQTPQDVRYHAEGPYVRDHLRQMLIGLYGLVEGRFHLMDLEEFRRLKGYEGEIVELEETLKEHVAMFEVFTLCHDLGKWSTAVFEAPEGSEGAKEGFVPARDIQFDHQSAKRLDIAQEYRTLYDTYCTLHPALTPQAQQAAFFRAYQIKVRYPNHAKKIHAPTHEALLERLCVTHRLPIREHDLLIDLISHHTDVIYDFQEVRPSRMRAYMQIANDRGFDADDYIDLMLGALLLDTMLGAKRIGEDGPWHDARVVVHALRSEHDAVPHRRVERMQLREREETRKQMRAFKEAGLDGESLLDVLGMDPGPDFGHRLRAIQAAILGKGSMPALDTHILKEIERRSGDFYKAIFETGE